MYLFLFYAELTIQLSVIMVGKQALGNVKEVLIPQILSWWKRRSLARRLFMHLTEPSDEQAPKNTSQSDFLHTPSFVSPLDGPRAIGQDKPFNQLLPWAKQYGLQDFGGLFEEYLEVKILLPLAFNFSLDSLYSLVVIR